MYQFALIQYAPKWSLDPASKAETFRAVGSLIREAASNGASVVALPEMWFCPYAVKPMAIYAEEESGETCRFMSRAAKENGVWLIGGSIAEKDGDRYYNTCFVYGPDGGRIARHRKNHVFGINIPGEMVFSEGRLFTTGEGPTVFETPFGKIGVAICYDVRFRDPIEREALMGAELVVLPASFGFATGKAHWDLLLRSRAVENQIYFAGINGATDPDETVPYRAYGHSAIYDPWGERLAVAGHGEEILYAEIDEGRVREIRERLPVMRDKLRIDRGEYGAPESGE